MIPNRSNISNGSRSANSTATAPLSDPRPLWRRDAASTCPPPDAAHDRAQSSDLGQSAPRRVARVATLTGRRRRNRYLRRAVSAGGRALGGSGSAVQALDLGREVLHDNRPLEAQLRRQ